MIHRRTKIKKIANQVIFSFILKHLMMHYKKTTRKETENNYQFLLNNAYQLDYGVNTIYPQGCE